MAILRDKRFILVVCLMALLAYQFWAGSRYPALNEKAAMGTENNIGGLAFGPLLKIAPDEKLPTRILYETINWTHTNRQGMTFGILFGALAMTLLSLLQRRSVHGRFGNTVMGMVIGTPLGVCANCAAPIGKAIHAAGGRTETMLAAMVSSPTLNVVILTMLFALLPVYMGVIKIGLTVLFILIGIPLLTRVIHTPTAPVIQGGVDVAAPDSPLHAGALTSLQPKELQLGVADSWLPAVRWVVRAFAVNLWFIVKTTVPLMLLAGFLGAVCVSLVPLESLADMLPSGGKRAALGLVATALIGVFLPVPMSFDVIATAILWQAGLPVPYAMALLFTLGIFSIYPFFIIWRAIGPRMATSLLVGLAALGVAAGAMAQEYFTWDTERQQQMFLQVLARDTSSVQGPKLIRAGGGTRQEAPGGELVASLQGSALPAEPMKFAATDGVSVARIPFRAPLGEEGGSGRTGKLFSRLEGTQLGIDEPYAWSVLTFVHPRVIFRGIASGDVHNDGWMDILLTRDSGLALYANLQGKGFARQPLDIPALKDLFVVNGALVDLNNDGWLDIYFSTYRSGSFVIYNDKGRFTQANLVRLPGRDQTVMTGAVAFGDVAKSGNLDIVQGDWTHPCRYFMPCEDRQSNNVLLRNDGKRFQIEEPFRGGPGRQTLSLLLSDLRNTGNLDLIVGNEDPAPDLYYFGNGDGTFRQIARSDGIVSYTTGSTMSVASADVSNDLRQAVYLGQISRMTGKLDQRRQDVSPAVCDEIVNPDHRKACQEVMRVHGLLPSMVKNRDTSKCLATDAQDYREDCIAYSAYLSAMDYGPSGNCDLFPRQWSELGFICQAAFREAPRPDGTNPRRLKPPRPDWIPIVGSRNVLLTPTADGRFVDKAGEMGVQVAGFTWNAKFADLDNDGFVDLYAVNGWLPNSKLQPHFYYQNEQGKRFVEKAEGAGLASYLPTAAYTYVDLNNDGNLDIVAVPIVGPLVAYMNNTTKNRIAFELRDHVGNRFGIGSKVIVHYGPGGALHQLREIQASGGFISFDAPIAYFGLGDFDRVERVEVQWSRGGRSEIRGDFQAGARYVLTR